MLTFRKGAGASRKGASEMVDHWREETLPPEAQALADYYTRGLEHTEEGTAAVPRRNMHPLAAKALGLDVMKTVSREEMVNLLMGLRADGTPIPGRVRRKSTETTERITYYDFTFSAPKSMSVAMALAETEAERYSIVGIHRDAVQASMEYLETIIGHARKGKNGSKGSVPGHIGWVQFDHYTARPTVMIPVTEGGETHTILQAVRPTGGKVAGDMQLHTHVPTLNMVACEDGSIGSLDTAALHDVVKKVGAFYQAHVATASRAAGIAASLDPETGMAQYDAVPKELCDLFSKRTSDGESLAREYAASQGVDWDLLQPLEQAKMLKGATNAARRSKTDDLADWEAWRKQAHDAGYSSLYVMNSGHKGRPLPDYQDRIEAAYNAALPILEEELKSRATMLLSVVETAATKGLIEAGIESEKDIDAVVTLMKERGVRQDGEMVSLILAEIDANAEGSADSGLRGKRTKVTTSKHIKLEEEVIEWAKKAAANKTGALRPEELERAISEVEKRDGLNFSTGHGAEQRKIIEALATGGRFCGAIGVGGAGKTTLLRPLVEAWQSPLEEFIEKGSTYRQVYGVALARRQADALVDAGIPEENTMPIFQLLKRTKPDETRNPLFLNENSVIVIDELSQVGTAQLHELTMLQQKLGFSVVWLGDNKQNQAVEAGASIDLLSKALGKNQKFPELVSSVRQKKQRDRETALLFREGKAEEGIARLREDGAVSLVPGDAKAAIAKVADLWETLTKENKDNPKYSLSISAATNLEAREISEEIRKRKKASGILGEDVMTVKATDQTGQARYDLSLAVGDRLRLFRWTRASFKNGRQGNLGNNGSVVTVTGVSQDGLMLKNARGNEGFVKWDTLTDRESGRVQLSYGEALTIDAVQGLTSFDHINSLAYGSKGSNSFRNYPAQSRAKNRSIMVLSQGVETQDIQQQRALGDNRPITDKDIFANVAAHLSDMPKKELATDLIEKANEIYEGTVGNFANILRESERRAAEGQEPFTRARRTEQRKEEEAVRQSVDDIASNIKRNTESTRKLLDCFRSNQSESENQKKATKKPPQRKSASTKADKAKRRNAAKTRIVGLLSGPEEERKKVQTEQRSMRPAASRPKKAASDPRPRKQYQFNEHDVKAEFSEALRLAGLDVRGDPKMDGQTHYVSLIGGKKSKKAGMYRAYLDGVPAGFIKNYKTGEEIRWKASAPVAPMTDEERAAFRRRIEAEQAARESERLQREESAARKALFMWNRAKAATTHPYLTEKGVRAHGIRQNLRGELLVPMRDVTGKLWNIQRITKNGAKLYLKGARKTGLFATLGPRPVAGVPVMIAEGYATAATMREATNFTVLAAFDAGNLKPVATAQHEARPDAKIIIAADNDHHLPLKKDHPQPNVGKEKAEEAARLVEGLVVLPPPDPVREAKGTGTDWNDYAKAKGLEAARTQLNEFFNEKGIIMPDKQKEPQAARRTTQAERDAARARATQTQQDARRAAEQAATRQNQNRPSQAPEA